MPKKIKKNKINFWLSLDAWLDSAIYNFFQSLNRNYTRLEDFMSFFHVSGFKRFLVEILSDSLTFGAIGAVFMLTLALPAFDETASGEFNKTEDYAIIFLDRYGSEIGRRGIRSDDSVELSELPDNLIKATIATEDRRFYEHFGIDPLGILRAIISNAQAKSVVEGGSSITQQIAKTLFLSSEQTFKRKIKEAFLSLWIEAHFTKDEILKLYFDRAYMGGGNFGVVAAADYYFDKEVQNLTLAEAAMMAGMFKAPSRYAPHIDLAAARGRANDVLSNMVEAGFLTIGQIAAAQRNPATNIERTNEINSPNYYLDWAFEEVKKIIEGSKEVGFIVRTTFDPILQDFAKEAVSSVLRENSEKYGVNQAAMVVTDINGAVRAMVGGLDYGKSQFNRAISSTRQPGSSFKPFVYATAFETGEYDPQTLISDKPVCIGNWCPQNYNRAYRGQVTLLNAFTRSINTVPVRLSIATGRQSIADMAHKMGIRNSFPVTRSLALGVASVSVLDMTSSYAVFANKGLKTPAFAISRITNMRSEVVFDAKSNIKNTRVLSEETAKNMNIMMRNVVVAGTGRRANVEGVPAAGKTGTTTSYRDAWFGGFTGNYVAVVWMGNDNYQPTTRLTGGSLPATIWQKFMEFAHTNIEVKPLYGVDFTPRPFVINENENENSKNKRPPILQPLAAEKLLNLFRTIDKTMNKNKPVLSTKSMGGLTNE